MKVAFMSGSYDPIDKLEEYLKKVCNINAVSDFYIGYKTIEVNEADYLKALTLGSMWVMRNQDLDICWVSPDNTRMHNINDLALYAKNCFQERKFVAMETIKYLETIRYSTDPKREYDPKDYYVKTVPDVHDNEFEEDEDELPNIDDMI